MNSEEAIQQAKTRAEDLYRSGQFLCSEAVLLVANEYLGKPMPDDVVRLASGFPVGIGLSGCVCGAISGGVMALGLKIRAQPARGPDAGDVRDVQRAARPLSAAPQERLLPGVDPQAHLWLA
jgi:hypothetical protein